MLKSHMTLRTLAICIGMLATAAALTQAVGVRASSRHETPKAPANTDCTLTYATFEGSVPHIDLEHCPGGETSDKVFCRAKTGYDEIIVFKFSSEGDQCLLSTKSYDGDHFNLVIFDLVVKGDE